jgi:hypothetical protein
MSLKSPEAVLRAALVADATMAGLVGTKIYPLAADTEATLPWVTWRRTAIRRQPTLAGPMGVPIVTIEFTVFAATYESARTVADRMRQVLDGYTGTADNTTVRQTSLEDESDDFATLNGAELPDAFAVRQQYEVLWQET